MSNKITVAKLHEMIIDLQEKVANFTLDNKENNLDCLIPITRGKALRLLYPCEVICLKQWKGQFTKGKTYIATGYTASLNIERDDVNSTSNGWKCEFFALPKIEDKHANIIVELTPIEAGAIMSAGRSKREFTSHFYSELSKKLQGYIASNDDTNVMKLMENYR